MDSPGDVGKTVGGHGIRAAVADRPGGTFTITVHAVPLPADAGYGDQAIAFILGDWFDGRTVRDITISVSTKSSEGPNLRELRTQIATSLYRAGVVVSVTSQLKAHASLDAYKEWLRDRDKNDLLKRVESGVPEWVSASNVHTPVANPVVNPNMPLINTAPSAPPDRSVPD